MNSYVIDTAHSAIHFSVRHMVFAKVRGRFDRWSAELVLDDRELPRSSVTVSIDAASIDTGNDKRDAHLRSPDFFDAERFPALTFRSTGVVAGRGGKLALSGLLTIRDVTREVVLEVEEEGRGKDPWGDERVSFSATTHLDRRDFGLRWNQVLEAGGVLVGDRIDIEIAVQAVKQVATQAA
jgi:polyisoprenoid-binding protein YceI